MKIAITRLMGKETDDERRCHLFGHECYAVSPLIARILHERIASFVRAVDNDEYDCIFFTSALPAQLIAPHLSRWPRVISIGPKTAKTLREFGIESEVLPAFYSRDFVPYLGDWIVGKRIGIPRADVPNPRLLEAIAAAGGVALETRCYTLAATGHPLNLDPADAVLFTSAMSYKKAVWERRPDMVVIAIGEITAASMEGGGDSPAVVGDGSLEGTLNALNSYLREQDAHGT